MEAAAEARVVGIKGAQLIDLLVGELARLR